MSTLLLVEQAAPDTPSSGQVIMYPKSDGLMYTKDDAGVESAVSTTAASQAQQETGSATNVFVSPGRQQYHPSAAKGWVIADFAGAIANSYNVTSITDGGSGLLTVTWATDFSGVSYSVHVSIESASPWIASIDTGGRAAGTTAFRNQDSGGTEGDADAWHIVAYGDQA